MKSLVLAVMGLLCSMSVSAHDFEVGGIYYNITSQADKTVAVTHRGDSYYSNEYSGEVTIPESVTYSGNTYSVTSIGDDAFRGCSSLTSVEIPNSVTSISWGAFAYCSSLTSVEIPNSVTSIGGSAFYNCSGLTSVEIPNSVTNIGIGAFEGCSGLTSVEIGNSVTLIGAGAFSGCTGLTSVNIEDIAAWCKIKYGLSYGDKVYVTSNPLFYAKNLYLNGEKVTDIVIPDSVTSIGDYAFYNCSSLTSVEIPNSVTSIGDDAFYGCENLKTVLNRSNLTFHKGSYGSDYANVVVNKYDGWLGDFIFAKDSDTYYLQAYVGNETDLVLPENYKDSNYAIGTSAFSGCSSLTAVVIPNSVTSIGKSAFAYCSGLASVNIGNRVTSIGSSAFNDCSSLTSLEIGNSVTSIGESAFWNCESLTSINIPNSMTSIGRDAFHECSSMSSVYIEDLAAWCKIDFSDEYANPLSSAYNLYLNGEKVTGLVIPGGVTCVGNYAFYNCSSLTSVEIPNSVTSIGDEAFYGCGNLKTILNQSDLTFTKGDSNYGYIAYYADVVAHKFERMGDFIFGEDTDTYYLLGYVGNETELVLPENYKDSNYAIGPSVFRYCEELISVEIPCCVTGIGDNAFYGCENLKTVLNRSDLTFTKGNYNYGYIAYYADVVINKYDGWLGDFIFAKDNDTYYLQAYVGNETELVLPENYKDSNYAIGVSVFKGCSGLTSVEIPNSVTSIGSSAFSGCSGLTSVVIPNSVTSIGSSAFKGCSGLTSVEIPNSVTSIGSSAFSGCSGLTSVEIGNSVTSIGSSAFKGCSGLTSVEIGNSVTSIGDDAFGGCSGLTSVEIGNSVTSIGRSAFGYCKNLKKLISHAEVPPVCGSRVFYGVNTQECTLQVPEKSISVYQQADQWKEFFLIEGVPTAIGDVTVDGAVPSTADVYSTNGMLIKRNAELKNLKHELPAGIYIIGGKKVLVK